MLRELIVRGAGGFFAFRNIVNRTRFNISRKIYSSIYYLCLEQHSSYVGLDTVFKNKPWLPHGTNGIFISGYAVIGKDCVIFPNVVIGSNTLPDSKGYGAPSIGDNCIIGAGATIIGNVKVGDNCRIGANTTISRDIPSNSTVTSEEPRIIPKGNVDAKFYMLRNNGWNYYQNGKLNLVTDPQILKKLVRKTR